MGQVCSVTGAALINRRLPTKENLERTTKTDMSMSAISIGQTFRREVMRSFF